MNPETAFEVVTLLPGLTTLAKRGGDLGGNLPVRAARYCGPVFEGNKAGFQITLEHPMVLARDRRGDLSCTMTGPALDLATEGVGAAFELGIRAGLITRGGFWHRQFRSNALSCRRGRALFWTGHLIRPLSGLWALVGGAFNRRSRVAVVDHVVTDADRFVPLVVEIETSDVGRTPVWLEAEVGCVTPLVPRVSVRKRELGPGAEELRRFADFFSESYFETKAQHPTAAYIRNQRKHRVMPAHACDADLAYIGPNIHRVERFRRFIGPSGFRATPPAGGSLEFSVVRNIAPARWTWQGQTHRVFEVQKERCLSKLKSLWRATFGDGHPSALEFLSGYLIGEQWDQPYVQLQPWVFMPTSPGWSTIVDGYHAPAAYDGMRAVIGTDSFSSLAMVYRLYGPAKAVLPYRAPLLRAIPVTRSVLDLPMSESVLSM
jgi:hypothetical protein